MAFNTMGRVRPEQQAALAGLRSALSGGRRNVGPGAIAQMQLDDAERNFAAENEQDAQNQLTMLATPRERRQHLAMNPAGRVYYPTPGSMALAGHEMVYGDTTGSGRQAPTGLGQLMSTDWAGFGAHFGDKQRFAEMMPDILKGMRSRRGSY